jgi:hypothetical protein
MNTCAMVHWTNIYQVRINDPGFNFSMLCNTMIALDIYHNNIIENGA